LTYEWTQIRESGNLQLNFEINANQFLMNQIMLAYSQPITLLRLKMWFEYVWFETKYHLSCNFIIRNTSSISAVPYCLANAYVLWFTVAIVAINSYDGRRPILSFVVCWMCIIHIRWAVIEAIECLSLALLILNWPTIIMLIEYPKWCTLCFYFDCA